MAKNKTMETINSAAEYINNIPDEKRRSDCRILLKLFEEASGYKAKVGSDCIVGFGSYHYKYESGHEGDAPLAAFASRKNAIVMYLYPGIVLNPEQLRDLGKHKAGKGCIYIKKLEDINQTALEKLIKNTISSLKQKYRVPGNGTSNKEQFAIKESP